MTSRKTVRKALAATIMMLLLAYAQVLSAQSRQPETMEKKITIYIGAEAEYDWPPYEFYKRNNGKITEELIGFNVDLLDEVFKNTDYRYEFKRYPWKRCLLYLEKGVELQITLPTSLNEERKRKFLASDRVYTVTPSYFYLKNIHPTGIQIDRPGEIYQAGAVCGRFGYNYTNFGLKNENIHSTASDYKMLIQLLRKKRCDIILARYEVLAAHKHIGKPYLTEDIGHSPMPGLPGEDFHFLISRNSEHAPKLLKIINSGITRLRKNGKLKKMLAKYIPLE